MLRNLTEVLEEALERTTKDEKDFKFALEQLKKMPLIRAPLSRLLSQISPSYLIRLINIIDKAASVKS